MYSKSFFPQELSIPAEVDLRVRVAVVEDHGEELGGWLQGGLLVHLGKQFLLAHEQNQFFGDKKKITPEGRWCHSRRDCQWRNRTCTQSSPENENVSKRIVR